MLLLSKSSSVVRVTLQISENFDAEFLRTGQNMGQQSYKVKHNDTFPIYAYFDYTITWKWRLFHDELNPLWPPVG